MGTIGKDEITYGHKGGHSRIFLFGLIYGHEMFSLSGLLNGHTLLTFLDLRMDTDVSWY